MIKVSKKYKYTFSRLLVVVVCVATFYSCNRITIGEIEGTYSYKTSGIVTLSENSSSFDASLDNIVGTLDVKRLPKGDSILLVFNELNNDVVTVRAEVKGDSIFFSPYQKVYSITTTSTNLLQVSTTTTSKYLVTLFGYGVIMDNSLIFYQRILSGKVLQTGKNQSIRSNNIKTVAKKNR